MAIARWCIYHRCNSSSSGSLPRPRTKSCCLRFSCTHRKCRYAGEHDPIAFVFGADGTTTSRFSNLRTFPDCIVSGWRMFAHPHRAIRIPYVFSVDIRTHEHPLFNRPSPISGVDRPVLRFHEGVRSLR